MFNIVCDLFIVPAYTWPVKTSANFLYFLLICDCLSFIDSLSVLYCSTQKLFLKSLTSLPQVLDLFDMNLGRREILFSKMRNSFS